MPMWVRKRIAKTVQWSWEISGFAGVEARKKAMKNASELWDDAVAAGKQVKQAALWVWEELGFGAKEATKAGIKATDEAVQTGAVIAGTATREGV